MGIGAGLLVALAYLLYAPLHFVALSDFHEISLAVPLLMAAGAALLERRLRLSLVCLALAILAKEEVILIVFGFGLYIYFVMRRRRAGAAVTIAAVLIGILVFKVLIPAPNGGSSYTFFNRYTVLGTSPGEMLRTLLV